jgi:hypothetical protein
MTMHHVRQEDLPFVGSSHEFVKLSRVVPQISSLTRPWAG